MHADPEKSLRQLFKNELEKSGFKLFSAAKLSEVQEILASHYDEIDMVIISELLTQEYVFWINMVIEHPSMPILLLSDSSCDNTSYKFVNNCIKKPYSLSELEDTLLRVNTDRTQYLIPHEKMIFILHHFLQNVTDAIRQNKSILLEPANIPVNDPRTFELLSTGKTEHIPLLNYEGITDYLRCSKVQTVSDLTVLIALYKPGPMDIIDSFVRRSAGIDRSVPVHALISHVVEETKGLLVYREQLIRILSEFGSCTEQEAVSIMNILGSQSVNARETVKRQFMDEAKKKGISAKSAEELFAIVKHMAPYLSSKEEASLKASLCYKCAYLKNHYENEYLSMC